MSEEQKRIYFGSLEGAVNKGGDDAKGAGPAPMGSDAIQAAIKAGNINIHNHASGQTVVMDLSEESREAQEKHADLLRRVEAERRARTMMVPTKPEDVKGRLRQLNQPTRLFGEGIADIRERLREFLAKQEIAAEEEGAPAPAAPAAPGIVPRGVAVNRGQELGVGQQPAKGAEVIYTEAPPALVEARRKIAEFSFVRTRRRLTGLKRRLEDSDQHAAAEDHAANVHQTMRRLVINTSNFADERPVSAVRCSPDGKLIASGSWSCIVKLWDIQSLESQKVLRGHTERVTGLSWHPEAYKGSGPPLLVTAGADMTARLWDCQKGEAVRTFVGHKDRLARVEFHPSGGLVGTASFDHTWRLWDVETGAELLLQDGHHKEVYSVSFQPDGALAATGDLGGVGRVWDLRSGKSILSLVGHVKRITCGDFAPNGYEVATGSDDHTIRFWDIRKQHCVYTLPAHSALISDVRYSQTTGDTLVSSSFDNTAKVWSTRDWGLLKVLSGHEGKVTAADITPDERHVVTCSFDRTIKVFAHENEF